MNFQLGLQGWFVSLSHPPFTWKVFLVQLMWSQLKVGAIAVPSRHKDAKLCEPADVNAARYGMNARENHSLFMSWYRNDMSDETEPKKFPKINKG